MRRRGSESRRRGGTRSITAENDTTSLARLASNNTPRTRRSAGRAGADDHAVAHAGTEGVGPGIADHALLAEIRRQQTEEPRPPQTDDRRSSEPDGRHEDRRADAGVFDAGPGYRSSRFTRLAAELISAALRRITPNRPFSSDDPNSARAEQRTAERLDRASGQPP